MKTLNEYNVIELTEAETKKTSGGELCTLAVIAICAGCAAIGGYLGWQLGKKKDYVEQHVTQN